MHNNEIYLTNARQMAAMEEALTSMQLVRQSIEDGMSEDFFSIDLMTAYSALGRIIGEAVEDDLVEKRSRMIWWRKYSPNSVWVNNVSRETIGIGGINCTDKERARHIPLCLHEFPFQAQSVQTMI